MYVCVRVNSVHQRTVAQNGQKVAKNHFQKFHSIYKGALCILRYLFYLYKGIFLSETDEYAHTVQWNSMVSNVQNATRFIRDSDTGLEVCYINNGNAI